MTKYELNERKLKTFKAWFWAVGIGLFISIIGSVWWFSINTTSAINVNKANIETLSKEIDSNINKKAGYFFLLGSFFFAFGLFSHYDMLFFSFLVIFIWYKIFGLKNFYKDEIFYKALLIFLFFTWIFYVPFVLNPGFNDAVNHYLERRVGVGAPPGLNIEWWLIQTSLYCSSYVILFLLVSSFFNLLSIIFFNLYLNSSRFSSFTLP